MRVLLASLAIAVTVASPCYSDSEIAVQERDLTPGATPEEIAAILSTDLISNLEQPTVLGFDRQSLLAAAEVAKTAYASLSTSPGATGESYDIVLQAGHFGRTKGATGGQGKFVTEQQYAAWITSLIADDLRKNELSLVVIPADGFNRPLKAKIFIALHTDASDFPCSVGPSIGYKAVSDSLGMHGIAAALAITLDKDPAAFMRDNYTKNLSGYYAYSGTNVSMFEGLLELSELTCPDDEELLLERGETLARNLSWAIRFALKP